MSGPVQIRHFPEDLRRTVKALAAKKGLSLSDYLLAEVDRTVERPTPAKMRERLLRRAPVRLRVPPTDAVRQERDQR